MPIQPRIETAESLPAELYHAMPYISFSQLKILLDNHAPVDFWYRSWMNPRRPGDDEITTKAMAFGRAMHCRLLEPAQFRERYTLEEKYKSTSKPNHIGAAPGGDLETINNIAAAIEDHPLAHTIIKGCRPEVSMLCELTVEDINAPRDKLFKFMARCRHDIYKEKYSADLKFVEDVSDSAIANMVARYHYHGQAEWYLRIMKECTGNPHQNFVFIFCEKKPPYKVRVVQVMEGPLAFARDRNDAGVSTFRRYMELYGRVDKPWPGYPAVINHLVMEGEGGMDTISLPSWMK